MEIEIDRPRATWTHLNTYLNFVLSAIYGQMAEADAMMRVASSSIERVAMRLARHEPFEPKPIYRGLLLDPAKPFALDPKLTFMSWSEDRDVATWFASPHTYISQPLGEVHDMKLRGYISSWALPERVLWHHSWTSVFGGIDELADLALHHPFMGAEGRRQIKWSLSTQREVITAPLAISPRPVDDLDEATIKALDQRFTPSWVSL